MVQVLFLIGSGKEEPDLIPRLLDVEQTPRKPQYDMASDIPLVLHDCFFDNVQFEYVAHVVSGCSLVVQPLTLWLVCV